MKWFLPFKAGKLEARAYNHGKVVARYDVVTTGKVAVYVWSWIRM